MGHDIILPDNRIFVLRACSPKGEYLWRLAERVSLEMAMPPMFGKESLSCCHVRYVEHLLEVLFHLVRRNLDSNLERGTLKKNIHVLLGIVIVLSLLVGVISCSSSSDIACRRAFSKSAS